MNRLLLTISVLTIALGFNSLAYGVIIDDFTSFTDSNWPVDNEASFPPLILTDTGSSIGAINDYRRTTISLQSGAAGDVDTSIRLSGANTILDYATGAADASLTLEYGSDFGGTSLNLDFTQGSIVSLRMIYFDFAFNQNLPITVTISDGTNNLAITNTLTTFVLPSTGANVDFDFTAGGNGVNLNNITSIQVAFDAQFSHDFQIDFIQTVPEPSTWAMIGALGAAGVFVGVRRRRKKAQAA